MAKYEELIDDVELEKRIRTIPEDMSSLNILNNVVVLIIQKKKLTAERLA